MAFIQNLKEGASKLLDTEDALINKKFFEQNFKTILIAFILLTCYIQMRYEYENDLLAIGRLKDERNDLRYTCIEKWSILTALNRPEVIKRKVAQSQVKLVESDERPIIVK